MCLNGGDYSISCVWNKSKPLPIKLELGINMSMYGIMYYAPISFSVFPVNVAILVR